MDTQKRVCWPGWETIGLIGRGSFGEVFKIQRDVLGDVEEAALKVISIPQNDSDIDEMVSDGYDGESITNTFQAHLKSIVAEYSLMRKMNGCANIVNCDDVRYVKHDDGIGWDIFIKMELLTPLSKAMPAEIPEEQVIQVGRDICAALEVCKRFDVIHRDIKPQNIFVSPMGDYKLGDFGIAKTVEKTMGGTKIGTYKYMAPEVYNNQPYGVTADIYSLGLVLYWMLNERRLPFMPLPPANIRAGMEEEARTRRFEGEPLPAPAHGSEWLKKIVLKACAFDPKDRYQSAAEMLEALNAQVQAIPISPMAHEPEFVAQEPMQEEQRGPDPTGHLKNPKRLILGLCASIAVLLILIPLLFGKKSFGEKHPSEEVMKENNPVQWSDWMDALPQGITAEGYQIEEQTLYRSRQINLTSSTSQNTMDGWELYDSVEAGAGYGQWSQWSENWVDGSDTRQVEQRQQYRYRDKEYTTGSTSSQNGWTHYNTTYSWSDYGNWSDWSTNYAAASDSRQVENKTQYRSRDITVTQEYGEWGAWSSWSDSPVSADNYTKVETRTVWGYYYYPCPECGAHMHGWDIVCPTWAGGCGKGKISRDAYCEWWSTTPYEQVASSSWYGTGKYYAYVDGVLVFLHSTPRTKTQYRYATRGLVNVINYGNWSSWSDSPIGESSSREVETRVIYRYRDRTQIATYHFWRWGGWSEWSSMAVSETEERQVESAAYYRYRDAVTHTTWFFRQYAEWSEYSTTPVEGTDELQVETKVQYRYKKKE